MAAAEQEDEKPTNDSHLLHLLERLKVATNSSFEAAPQLYSSILSQPLKNALYMVLCETKEEIAQNLAARSVAERHEMPPIPSDKLDSMLCDCLAGAEMGPPSPEPGYAMPLNEELYKRKLSKIKERHHNLMKATEEMRNNATKDMSKILTAQMEMRPISKEDYNRMIDSVHHRFVPMEEEIKKQTVNDIMIINDKCLDARRRRRNFSKETTEILMAFFNENIDHPYPSDEQKQMLAAQCRMTVQQVSNWFGNRRIRQKRQSTRPLQPPIPQPDVLVHPHQSKSLHAPQIGYESTLSHPMTVLPPIHISSLPMPPALLNMHGEEHEQISSLVRSSLAFMQ